MSTFSSVATAAKALGHPRSALKRSTDRLKEVITKPVRALKREAEVGPLIHDDVLAALHRIREERSRFAKELDGAYGYAVVPSIGRASAVLGGAYGVGELFERGRVIGYASIVQLTLGVQLGGETFHEVVVFHSADALKRFKAGKLAFAANASVAIVKGGAEAAKGFGDGTKTLLFSEGGLLLSFAIGGQKLIYRPAALGRLRTDADQAHN
jgi:lipid-binding SYLF domain-containing protein